MSWYPRSLKVRALLSLAGWGLVVVLALLVPSVALVRGILADLDRETYTGRSAALASAIHRLVQDLHREATRVAGARVETAAGRWQPLDSATMVALGIDQLVWLREDGAIAAATHLVQRGDQVQVLSGLSPDLSLVLETLAHPELRNGTLQTPVGPLAVGKAERTDGGRILALRRLTPGILQQITPGGWNAPEVLGSEASFLSAQETQLIGSLQPGAMHYEVLGLDSARCTTVVDSALPDRAMAIRISGARSAVQRSNPIVLALTLAVSIGVLATAAAACVLVKRWVVDRVENLRQQVESITKARELDRRAALPGDDEINALATAINFLLAARERMTSELEGEIRERVRVQERLCKLNRELESTLQFRQDLSNMLVHDIRSPLTVIDFFLQIQARKQGEKADTSLQLAQRSVNRLNMMINDLLIMAKFEAGKVVLNHTEFDLRQLINRNIDEVRFLAQKRGVRIIDELPEHAVMVDLDANLLWRVLENLLGNAVKYSPENRPVIVRLEHVERSNFFESAPEEVRLSVIDEGPGIPNELHEAIFEKWNIGKFDRSKSQIGLGLSFCRMIVEAQGGRIWVENNTPHGSIFRVVIPGVPTAPKKSAPASVS